MKKAGFTLAEVLITLMIIGVVATLTTPALVKNVGSSKIGPQLSKFVNTFETAAETFMMEENVSTIASSDSFDSGTLSHFSKYMIMSQLQNDGTKITIRDANGQDIETIAARNFWQLKDGTLIMPSVTNSLMGTSIHYSAQGSYKGYVGSLLVDIGGIKGAHRAGKEVFAFVVDNSGVLIPFASNAHRNMYNGTFPQCSHSGGRTQNFACTGAVADNGWKAPW